MCGYFVKKERQTLEAIADLSFAVGDPRLYKCELVCLGEGVVAVLYFSYHFADVGKMICATPPARVYLHL